MNLRLQEGHLEFPDHLVGKSLEMPVIDSHVQVEDPGSVDHFVWDQVLSIASY